MAKTIQAKKSSDRIHKTEVRVIYADTDHGGVAYYASYLRWFEVGRTELLRSVGLTYSEIEKSGILCPVVEVQCRYIQPARYDDILLIKTRIEKLGRSHIIFGYEIDPSETEPEALDSALAMYLELEGPSAAERALAAQIARREGRSAQIARLLEAELLAAGRTPFGDVLAQQNIYGRATA